MQFLVVLALMALVVVIVAAPLRRERVAGRAEPPRHDARDELEAARDAKLREIRDAELDHGTGKLSDEDFARLDSELRGEAAAILSRLDELASPPPG